MNAESLTQFWRAILRHAPGAIIGSYFLALQYTAVINLSYLILLSGALFLLAAQPNLNWRLFFSKPTALAGALFFSTLLSTVLANRQVVNPNIGVSQIPGLLIYLIIVLCINNTAQLRFIMLGLLASLCATTWSFLSASLHADFARSIKLIFLTEHPLFLAANDVLMFSILTPLALWFGLRQLQALRSSFSIVYIVLVGLLSVLLLSRISLIIIGASVVGYFSRAVQRRWLALAAIFSLIILAVVYCSDSALAAKLHSLDLTRLRVWMVAARMFMDAPWFGNGPGSFSVLYGQYVAQMPIASSLGYEGRNMGWAHSWFFEAAAEKGLLGLSIVIAYFIYAFSAVKNKLRKTPDAFLKALGLCVAMCLIASFIEMSMLRVWGIFIVYLLLALVAVFTAPKPILLD